MVHLDISLVPLLATVGFLGAVVALWFTVARLLDTLRSLG